MGCRRQTHFISLLLCTNPPQFPCARQLQLNKAQTQSLSLVQVRHLCSVLLSGCSGISPGHPWAPLWLQHPTTSRCFCSSLEASVAAAPSCLTLHGPHHLQQQADFCAVPTVGKKDHTGALPGLLVSHRKRFPDALDSSHSCDLPTNFTAPQCFTSRTCPRCQHRVCAPVGPRVVKARSPASPSGALG